MKRRKKKKAAKDVESAHLDGAGSARSFGSAAAGSVPEAFFVAPRNALRISHPAPGPPRPGRDLPGRDPPGFFPGEIYPRPRVGSSRYGTAFSSGKLVPIPGWDPPSSSPPPAPLMLVGNPQTIKGGCRQLFPAAVPTGSPAACPVRRDPRATPGPGDMGPGCPSAARPDRNPRARPWPW